MTQDDGSKKIIRPVRWNALRPDEAEQVVRQRAGKTPSVIFSDHAFERIAQRSITQADALTILRQGHVEGDPLQTASGDWKVVVVRRMPGGREAGAVTVIYRPPSKDLFVVTVEWMDTKR